MQKAQVRFDSSPAKQARALLDAADELGLEKSVVETFSDGFEAPEEVADKAGLSYALVDADTGEPVQPSGDVTGQKVISDEELTKVKGSEVEFDGSDAAVTPSGDPSGTAVEPTDPAKVKGSEVEFDGSDDVPAGEVTVGGGGGGGGGQAKPETPAPKASDFPKVDPSKLAGKALDEALVERGLSKNGKVAAKRARLTKFQNQKG